MDDTDAVSAAAAMRRSVLGEGHVDGVASSDPSTVDFQKWVTSAAWGVWARGGPLSVRDRSLLVMAMTAALGRMDEFRMHLSSTPTTGVTDGEVEELVLQIGAYCGAPAAVSARRVVTAVRAERDGTT